MVRSLPCFDFSASSVMGPPTRCRRRQKLAKACQLVPLCQLAYLFIKRTPPETPTAVRWQSANSLLTRCCCCGHPETPRLWREALQSRMCHISTVHACIAHDQNCASVAVRCTLDDNMVAVARITAKADDEHRMSVEETYSGHVSYNHAASQTASCTRLQARAKKASACTLCLGWACAGKPGASAARAASLVGRILRGLA
jgi:hypothetical protein